MLLGKWEYNNEITHNKEKKSGRETSCSNCLIRLYKLKLVLIHLYRDLGCLIEIESKQFRILPSYGFLNILSSFENGKFPNHLLHIVIISFRFKIIFNWSSIYLNMKLDGYLKSFKYLQYNSWKLNSAIVILKSSWNDYKFQCSRWDNISRCAIYRLDWNKQKTFYRRIFCLVKYHTNMKKFDQYLFFHACHGSRFLSFSPFLAPLLFAFPFVPTSHFSFLLASHFFSSALRQTHTKCKIEFTFFLKWHWLENAMNSHISIDEGGCDNESNNQRTSSDNKYNYMSQRKWHSQSRCNNFFAFVPIFSLSYAHSLSPVVTSIGAFCCCPCRPHFIYIHHCCLCYLHFSHRFCISFGLIVICWCEP